MAMENKNLGNNPEMVDVIQQQPLPPPMQSSRKQIIVLFVILGLLVFGIGGYYIGSTVNRASTKDNNLGQYNTPTPTTIVQSPQPTNNVNALGQSTFSYLENQNDIYIKATIDMNNPIVEYPNSKLRTVTRVFTQQVDQGYEPVEVKVADIPSGSWAELIKEPVDNHTNAGSIQVSDSLFSFKRVPNSNNFLFAIELMRSAGQAGGGSWAPTKFERVLYFYDNSLSSNKLKKVQVFDKDNFKYSFPKIDTFSSDGRYVSIKLFACWGCGGHVPETYLLDTQTLKNKNIGQVSHFEWKNNGNYGYKDYVVIECSEPTPGECSQDPNTLPLKTGSI